MKTREQKAKRLVKLKARLAQTLELEAHYAETRVQAKAANTYVTAFVGHASVVVCKRRAKLENQIADLEYELGQPQ